ncbi:MAG: GNAT family N-acetyltransferase [Oscillospiraceae bacterium]|nr:GNAT family N-acetyltransferase [Oscillospiraceae bacterium]
MDNLLTERLVLSLIDETDLNELTTLFTCETIRRYLGGAVSSDKALATLNSFMQDDAGFYFVVRSKTSNELVGMIIVARHHNQNDVEISFLFLPNHWGKGYAREGVKCALTFCKTELKIKRVVSETQSANKNAQRLLEALGYKVENILERFGAMQTIYVYDYDAG